MRSQSEKDDEDEDVTSLSMRRRSMCFSVLFIQTIHENYIGKCRRQF